MSCGSTLAISLVVFTLFVLSPPCHAQQDCTYVMCGPAGCHNPINIPGKCCPICPPAAGSGAPNAPRCPRVDITLPCGDRCATDMDCSAGQMCCDHGCGKSCRDTVTVASGPCPQGRAKQSTKCEMLSGVPCGVGYYCKHSLAAGFSECCSTPDYSGYQNHPCETYLCSPVHCTETYVPQGECCPACRPEVPTPATVPPTSGQFYSPSNQALPNQQPPYQQQQQHYQPPPIQPQQSLQHHQSPPDPCLHAQCPQVNCMYPVLPPGQCCHVCQNTVPATVPSVLPPATYAPTMLESLKCMFSFCQDVNCPNSYIPTGECCRVCPPDPCMNAVCPSLSCTTTWKPDGQCCPICTVLPARECFFKGQSYGSGRGFQNGCNNCTCTDGHIFCSNYTCEQPCRHNGNGYNSGVTVYSNECQTCTCGNGVIFCTEDICRTTLRATQKATQRAATQLATQLATQRATQRATTQSKPIQRSKPQDPCRDVPCSTETCVVTYQPVGTCCPICLKPGECLYEGKVYVNGAVKLESCQKCTCMDGLMVCSNECFKRETTKATTVRPTPMRRQPFPQRQPSSSIYQPAKPRNPAHINYQPAKPQNPAPINYQPAKPRNPAPINYQPEPVRQPPPPPPPKPSAATSFKRGPPPRPPPGNSPGKPGKPPLLVQSSLELQVVKEPQTQKFQSQPQTFNAPPKPYKQPAPAYVNPPPVRNQAPAYEPQPPTRPIEPNPYPDIQSTGNKPVRAEVYQTYPKVEMSKRQPIQTQAHPLEQLHTEHSLPPNNFPSMPPRPPGAGSFQSGPGARIPPTRYPPVVSQGKPGLPLQGRIVVRNTGPKSSDEKCRIVNCPEINCPNYVIPRGECCAICKPKKEVPKKPGTCPPVRRVGLCVNFCKTDQECKGAEICCHNGCGTQCFPPVLKR